MSTASQTLQLCLVCGSLDWCIWKIFLPGIAFLFRRQPDGVTWRREEKGAGVCVLGAFHFCQFNQTPFLAILPWMCLISDSHDTALLRGRGGGWGVGVGGGSIWKFYFPEIFTFSLGVRLRHSLELWVVSFSLLYRQALLSLSSLSSETAFSLLCVLQILFYKGSQCRNAADCCLPLSQIGAVDLPGFKSHKVQRIEEQAWEVLSSTPGSHRAAGEKWLVCHQ